MIIFKVSCTASMRRWNSWYIGIKHFIFDYKIYKKIGLWQIQSTYRNRNDLPISQIMFKLQKEYMVK